jgi:integrase
MSVIQMYLSHHPLSKTKSKEYKFLVKADGTPMTVVNAITRVLNKVLGKNVGSSMLRHIYLTDKYEDNSLEREKDAEAMGHSVAQQKDYIKPLD